MSPLIWVRFLFGMLVGIITASSIGISVGSYIGYSLVVLGICIVVTFTFGLIVYAVSGNKEYEGFVIAAVFGISVLVSYNWGFTFYQFAVLSAVGMCSTFFSSLVLPINRYND